MNSIFKINEEAILGYIKKYGDTDQYRSLPKGRILEEQDLTKNKVN